LRGPIGRWFVWDTSDGGPLLLVAGGSGVVPLRAILRHHQRSGSDVPVRLLYSSRMLADVIYRGELDQYRDGAQVIYTLTRGQPPGWTGYTGRVDAAMLAEIAWPPSQHPLAFVCEPTSFVETVAEKLVGLGYPSGRRRGRPGRRDGCLPVRAGDCGPLPHLLRHAHGHLADPGHELRRPPRPGRA
jgi:NAD(P)H-flavin reductase